MHCLQSVFGDRKINRGLWPTRSPDPNSCGFYTWDTLQCSNNPRSEDELKEQVQRLEISVSPTEIQCVVKLVLVRVDTCVRAEGKHFRYLR